VRFESLGRYWLAKHFRWPMQMSFESVVIAPFSIAVVSVFGITGEKASLRDLSKHCATNEHDGFGFSGQRMKKEQVVT